MAPNDNSCSICRKTVPNKGLLKCCKCKYKHHLHCANVTEIQYQAMTSTNKSSWTCTNCCSKPAKANSSTPIVLNKTCSSTDFVNTSYFEGSSDDGECNVTLRQKSNSRNVSTDSLVQDLHLEDKLRTIIKQEFCFLETKIKVLVTDQLKQMTDQISDFKDSMNFYNTQYETLKSCLEEKDTMIRKLQAENERLLTASTDHSMRLSLVEQNLRVNNIEINGIPEYKTENVITTVIQLAKAVGEQLGDGDILHATRVAKLNAESNRPRPMVVKLRTPRLRDSLIAAVVNFNKKKQPQEKLNSKHLGIGGDQTPVYVSEHLCPANKQLHAATRQSAKELGYKFVWVRNGRVFVRKDVTHAAILIRNLESLALLKTKE